MEIKVGPGKEYGEVKVNITLDYDEDFVRNFMKKYNSSFEAAVMAYQGMRGKEQEYDKLQEEVKKALEKTLKDK